MNEQTRNTLLRAACAVVVGTCKSRVGAAVGILRRESEAGSLVCHWLGFSGSGDVENVAVSPPKKNKKQETKNETFLHNFFKISERFKNNGNKNENETKTPLP